MEAVRGQITLDPSKCLSTRSFRTKLRGVVDSSAYIHVESELRDTLKYLLLGGRIGKAKALLDRSIERTPSTLLLDLHSERYSLKRPIFLQRQVYQGYVLVSDVIIYRHGLGISIEEAILDYEDDIIDYFESLRRNRQNLSSALEADLEELEQLIKER